MSHPVLVTLTMPRSGTTLLHSRAEALLGGAVRIRGVTRWWAIRRGIAAALRRRGLLPPREDEVAGLPPRSTSERSGRCCDGSARG